MKKILFVLLAMSTVLFTACEPKEEPQKQEESSTPTNPSEPDTPKVTTITWNLVYLTDSIGTLNGPASKTDGIVTLSLYGNAYTLVQHTLEMDKTFSMIAPKAIMGTDKDYFTFSCESGKFSRIEMTVSSNRGVEGEGWVNNSNPVVWTGDSQTATITSCSVGVSQIVFTISK